MAEIIVHVLFGGMTGGPLDFPVNGGMRDLIARFNKLSNVYSYGVWWNHYPTVIGTIQRFPMRKHVVIGYSGGGSRATYLVNHVPRPTVNLLIAYDPSPAWQMQQLHGNVKRAICYHNLKPGMWFPGVGKIGGGMLTSAADGPHVEVHIISQFHMSVDSNPVLHAMTIAAVKAL